MKHFFFLLLFLIYKTYDLNTPSKEYLNLVNWIIENGGYISPKLYPVENDKSNRYIITKEKILRNEKIISIPNSIILSTMNILLNEICRKVYILEYENYDFECLVYFMTFDLNNKSSFFYPYYNYLPKIKKNDFYLYLPEEIKEKISKTELGNKIKFAHKYYDRSLAPINNIIKEKNLTERFNESYILVSSRNFGRNGSFWEDLNSMVPYIDLLNHGNDYNIWIYYDDIKSVMEVFAIKDIEKGNEIINFYGDENNIVLYTYFGFIIKNNIYHVRNHIFIFDDCFVFDFNSANDDDVLDKINQIMRKKNFSFKEAIKILYEKLNEKKVFYENIKTSFDNLNYILYEEKFIIEKYIDFLKKYIK